MIAAARGEPWGVGDDRDRRGAIDNAPPLFAPSDADVPRRVFVRLGLSINAMTHASGWMPGRDAAHECVKCGWQRALRLGKRGVNSTML